jgi:hypothetical protein
MIRADIRGSRHLLQRERLVEAVMHQSNDALYRLTMRDNSGRPHIVQLPNVTVDHPGRVVDADSIHSDSE